MDEFNYTPYKTMNVITNLYPNLNSFVLVKGAQGWGSLSQFPPFRYFPKFSALSKHTLPVEYHVYIWEVSPQPSCGDTCQIWMWFEESNMYFREIENSAYGEINERSFSNPHPRATSYCPNQWCHSYSKHHSVIELYGLITTNTTA